MCFSYPGVCGGGKKGKKKKEEKKKKKIPGKGPTGSSPGRPELTLRVAESSTPFRRLFQIHQKEGGGRKRRKGRKGDRTIDAPNYPNRHAKGRTVGGVRIRLLRKGGGGKKKKKR